MASLLRFVMLALSVVSLLILGSSVAVAQAVTCRTPYFDCQANPPGTPGTVCFCPTGNGWVQGVLI